MTVRDSFVETFGEEAAQAVEDAAQGHENGVHDNRGSDPFKWAIAICIGYECMSKDDYREWHGFTPEWESVKNWIKEHGELGTHDGDVDYISLVIGAYNEFVPEEVK
jgi:hypothetical protein